VPAGLQASAGSAQVSLSWTASSGATSYNVKRSTTSGSGYVTISSPTATNYTDTGVTNDTTYYYVVTAVNSSGESGNSAEVNAKTSATVTPNVTITIDPTKSKPISLYIYGLNFYFGNTNPPALLTLASAQSQSTIEPVAAGHMAASGSSLTVTLPALSVTTIDVH
jgi:fibronectin type III domain protein